MRERYFIRILTFGLCLWLCACGSNQSGRYSQKNDSMPDRLPTNVTFEDAKPKYEPYKPANLRPYRVLGKYYQPLPSAKGYSQTGNASWYGQKFHGHLTANGERYDMYAMTAAHKTLPLPAYVQVTNLANGRQTIVRVNDRGPFHDNRIIDLSYAAALKLGMLSTGTARVKLEAIHIDTDGQKYVGTSKAAQPADVTNAFAKPLASMPTAEKNNTAPSITDAKPPITSKQLFVQITASKSLGKIENVTTKLSGIAALYQLSPHTEYIDGVYRLRLGPVSEHIDVKALLTDLHDNGYAGAFKTYL